MQPPPESAPTTPPVVVVAESVCCLPAGLYPELILVPMWVLRDDRGYRDGLDVTVQQVVEWLKAGAPYPTASAPSAGDYLQAFEEAARRGARQVLALTVARWLSGAHDNARRAAARSPVPVEVVDTGTAAAAQGLVVLEALRRLREGTPPEDVARWASWAGPRSRLVALVRSLDHLYRSGRVPRVAHLMNVHLKATPLFAIGGGRIRRAGLAVGLEAATRRLVSEVRRVARFSARLLVAVTDAAMPEEAERLAAALRDLGVAEDVWHLPFTPVMVLNTGPEVLGVAYLPEE